MIRLELLFLCRDFKESIWQLPVHVPSGISRGLLGWRTSPPAVDAGVPEPVGVVLATALSRHAVVSFPCATGKSPPGGNLVRRKWRLGTHFNFLHATDAAQVQQIFACESFDWTLQAQVGFLSALGKAMPMLNENHLR